NGANSRDFRSGFIGAGASVGSHCAGLSGLCVGLIGLVHRLASVIVGRHGPLFGSADATLGALIHRFDLFSGLLGGRRIAVGLFTDLVYFGLNRRRGVSHVLLRGASTRQHGASQ